MAPQRTMSNEEVDRCRLCSSQKNLISMFSGKSKTTRNSLRKMIEETVHIRELHISNYKAKKLKLHCSELKEIQSPDIKTTESILNWLSSKRINLADTTATNLTVDRVTQTHQSQCDFSSQSNLIEMVSKESQTKNCQKLCDMSTQSNMMETVSKMCQTVYLPTVEAPSKEDQAVKSKLTQCKNGNNDKTSEILTNSRKTRSSSGTSHNNEKQITDCTKYTKSNSLCSPKKCTKNKNTQTIMNNEPKSIQTEYHENEHDSYCQTDNCEVFDSFSQTEHNTKDGCSQTEAHKLVDQNVQCDLLHVKSYRNSILPINGKNSTGFKETRSSYKITDSQTFTDALLNGFDNIFISKETQTEVPMNHCEYCIFSNNLMDKRDSSLLAQSKNLFSQDITSKISIKIPFPQKVKEEKISPVESLQLSCIQSPDKFPLMSPQSRDLLQVNRSKSDFVKVCKLCDQTLYNKREIMMHNKTHMQCNICKQKFRSFKATQNHMNDCKVKQTNILPSVCLVRIEEISGMKETHSEAFEKLSV